MDYSKGDFHNISILSLAESVAARDLAAHFTALFDSGDYWAGNPLTRDTLGDARFQLVAVPPVENPQAKWS